MSRAVEKLLRSLEREYKRIDIKLNGQMDNLFKKYLNPDTIISEYDENKIVDSVYNELNIEQFNLFDVHRELCLIIDRIKNNKPFNNFAILQRHMDKYLLSSAEQADVLAHILGVNIKESLSLLETIETAEGELGIDMLKLWTGSVSKVLDKILPNLDFKSDVLKELQSTDTKEAFNILIINRMHAHKELSKLIVNGIIKGMPNASDYKKTLMACQSDMSDAQIDLIIRTSEEKYAQEQNPQEEMIIVEKVEDIVPGQIESKIIADNKARREALQELKKYLNNDAPIRYLEYEEVKKLENLLKIAGYSFEQIFKIEKLIAENNERILNAQKLEKIEIAKLRLSIEHRELLFQTEEILNNPDSTKNFRFAQMKEIYESIQELLLSDSEEEIELTLLYLEDLREIIISYYNSDYRLLMKKGNNENE